MLFRSTVAGTPTRSYHGLLVAALEAPADPCTRTLLAAAAEEHWGWARPGEPHQALETLTPINHRAITAFRLDGTVPCWRYALGDALLEKRIWMRPGAHTTTVHYRLLQSSQPVRLSLTVLVNARSHHGGTTHPEMVLRAVPRGVEMAPQLEGVPPFVVRGDRGDTTAASPDEWCWG